MHLHFNLPLTINITNTAEKLYNELKHWGHQHDIEVKMDKTYFYLGFLKVFLPSDRAYELFCLSWKSDTDWKLRKE